jgi:uncharacterized protein with FMN-binding domain
MLGKATSPARPINLYRRGTMTFSLRTANTRSARAALFAVAGLSVVGTLAGCSATSTGSTSGSGSGTSGSVSSGSTASTGSSGSTTTSSSTTYKDGTYTAPGTYISPGGTEHISVTLTLAKDVITSIKVTTVKADPTATGYEQMFEGGISAVTVGKNIDSLNVGVVAGSSLTSMGFNKALATIKADAKS